MKTHPRGNSCRRFGIRLHLGVNPVKACAALISSTVMAIWKTLAVAIPCGTGIAKLKHVPEVTRARFFGFVFPRE
jgi:hypothetical protein